MADAIAAAQDGDTITLLWSEGDAPIAMNGAVYGKTVTITGTATVDWSKGFLFIGRGGEGNGTVIFDNAQLTSASNQATYGIHVSGREKNTNDKYNGTLTIKNSTIELDYLINRGAIEVDNSKLTVKNGFGIAGRPATETETGEAATATITIKNGSYVNVLNHNGMGVGMAATVKEGYGILNLIDSTFECNNFDIDSELGDFNVSGTSTVKINKLTGKNIDIEAGTTLKDSTIGGSINMLGNLTIDGGLTLTGGLWASNGGILSGDTLTARYFMFQTGTYTINANIEAVYGYLSFNGTFEVNSKIHTTGTNGEVLYINGNVTLNNGAVLDSDNSVFLSDSNAVLTIKSGAKIESNLNITKTNAKLKIDITGMTAGNYAAITGTVTNNNGTIEVINNDKLEAKIVDGKIVLAVKPVAQIGDVYYTDLHEAMVACKSGETVLLLADVDLSGTEWEPVSFQGTFNGQNHVIENLTINKPGVSNVGFITSLNGTFKNVTFTNPTVTGGECTGVVAGRAGGQAALAENITVNGTIKVQTTHSGYARAGVIVGGWAYGNYKNITVDGGDKATSYIKHTGGGDGRYVAGIVGHADDVKSYENCTVKNITISGGWLCGGIAGPGPADGISTGCVVENINMGADYSGGMFGWYFGDGTIKDSTIKNVEFTDGTTSNGAIGGYSTNKDANVSNVIIENVINNGVPLLEHVAQVNNVYYFSLADAIAAANGKTITLIDNVVLTDTLTIPAGVTVTLDLNGKTISMEDASGKAAAAIKNNGNLTITSSVEGGKITFNSTTPSANNGYASNTISNYGTITIAGGIIENTTVGGACYALDNYAGSTATISGGKLTAAKTTVRIFNWTNGEAAKATLNITGGEIISEDGYGVNINAGNTPNVALNISGGTITTNDTDYNLAVYVVNKNSAENLTIKVEGGAFNGDFALNGVTSTTMKADAIVISGGSLDGVICYGTPAYGFVSGGTFKTDVSDYCVDGYKVTENTDGTYGVAVDPAYGKAAKIGDTYYETLADAIAAVQANETITLLADVTLSEILVIDKAITLDGNGKKLTSSAGRAINVSGADGVIIKNLTIECSGERAINIIQNATNVTIDNVIATANNYTVNVATSSPNAVVAIKNSTLNGLCTVNVSAEGAQVTIDESTINCNDNNTTAGESYAALSLNKDAVGGSIVATNSTIYVTEGSDSFKGRNGAENGTVTINGSTEDVTVTVAVITYAGSDNYHGFATLAAAIEFAKAGDTIKLILDTTFEGTIVLNKGITLDLNGHTLEAKYLVAFKGNHVTDNSRGKGLLKLLEKDNISLSKDNANMAVWVGNGYKFARIVMNTGHVENGEDGFTVQAKPSLGPDVNAILKNNEVFKDSAIQIIIRLSWMSNDGQQYQDVVFSDTLVNQMFNAQTQNEDWLTLKVSGVKDYTNLKATLIVKSDSGIETMKQFYTFNPKSSESPIE